MPHMIQKSSHSFLGVLKNQLLGLTDLGITLRFSGSEIGSKSAGKETSNIRHRALPSELITFPKMVMLNCAESPEALL